MIACVMPARLLAEVSRESGFGPARWAGSALLAAVEQAGRHLRPCEALIHGLRIAGYSRDEIAELTGDSHRSIDRQLGRGRHKLRDALRAAPAIG